MYFTSMTMIMTMMIIIMMIIIIIMITIIMMAISMITAMNKIISTSPLQSSIGPYRPDSERDFGYMW